MVRATITGRGLPLIVVKALICREFGWTPSELDAQPADQVWLMWQTLNFYEEQMSKRIHLKGPMGVD